MQSGNKGLALRQDAKWAEIARNRPALWLTEKRGLLAVSFVFYGIFALAFFAIIIPPFQNPDELAHLARAFQISDGGMVGRRFIEPSSQSAGGNVDPEIFRAELPFSTIRFHTENHVSRVYLDNPIAWSGTTAPEAFPNTANYPPQFYLPAALAIRIGRASGATIVQTVVLARLMTGVVAISIGALAVLWSGAAAPWVFAILTLPMSLSLMSSYSVDALLISGSALAVALYIKMLQAAVPERSRHLLILALLLGLLFMGRPPLGAASILLLLVPGVSIRMRVASFFASATLVLGWAAIVSAKTMTNFAADLGADPARQLALIGHHPGLLISLLLQTAAQDHLRIPVQFVGVLGWLDTVLPPWYYFLSHLGLLAAACATMCCARDWTISPAGRALIACGLIGAVIAIYLIQYLSWTAVGAPTVQGVQGRYFLSIALIAALLLPGFGRRWYKVSDGLTVIVGIFPVVTLAVAMHAVVTRYYLQ